MESVEQIKSTRSIRTDVVKVIAAFFVVIIHISNTTTAVGIFFNAISRFSVPVFVIASGYHMLNRPASYCSIFKKCVRLFILMLLWSAVFLCYGLCTKTQQIANTNDLLKYLFTQPVHLWYLYAAIALYLFTPLLSIFCKYASQKDYQYALLITFLLGSPLTMLMRTEHFPTLKIILDKAKVPYMLGFLFLYLLGGYFQRFDVKNKFSRVFIYITGIIGIIVTAILAILSLYHGRMNEQLLSFFAPGAMIAGAALFLSIRHLSAAHFHSGSRIYSIVRLLSNCTLGIYLSHPLFILIMQHIGIFPHISGLKSVPLIPCTAIVVFFLSAVFTAVGSHIPVLCFLFGEKTLTPHKFFRIRNNSQ